MKAVLLTGIYGIGKRDVAKRFRKYYLTQYLNIAELRNLSEDEFEALAPEYIPIAEIFRTSTSERNVFLDKFYETIKNGKVSIGATKAKLAKAAESPKFQFAIIHTHLSYYLTGHFRSWMAWVDVADFFSGVEVYRIINLIDNVFVHFAKCAGEQSMKDLLVWRDLEIMMSEMLATQLFPGENLRKRAKIFGVNHSLKNLAKLVDPKDLPSVYLAYPISAVRRIERREPDRAREILLHNKEFRIAVQERLVIFDPSTIDELPMVMLDDRPGLPAWFPWLSYPLDESSLWPRIGSPDELVAADRPGPWRIPHSELVTLRATGADEDPVRGSIVAKHVRSRDLTLVTQADGVIVYRPTLSGRWSASVEEEVRHASDYLRCPFYIIRDRGDPDVNIGRDGVLDYKIPASNWGVWDLSKPESRQLAFKTATDYIIQEISRSQRGDVE